MKRLLTVTLVMLAICTVSFAQSSIEKTLMDLEGQWVKAALAGKGEALAPLLATDFVSIQSDGTAQTKAQYVAMTNKGKWQVSEVSDMNVQVHGDSAVVTGTWTGKGTDGMGRAVDTRERFADTWVKIPDGKWQCVASASAPMMRRYTTPMASARGMTYTRPRTGNGRHANSTSGASRYAKKTASTRSKITPLSA